MIQEIKADLIIVKNIVIIALKILNYIREEIVYSFYIFITFIEDNIKHLYSKFQIYLYNRNEKLILKDGNYSRLYIYVVSKIDIYLFIHIDDLNNIVETNNIRYFKETNMLGFTSKEAYDEWLIKQTKMIYIIKQEELDE